MSTVIDADSSVNNTIIADGKTDTMSRIDIGANEVESVLGSTELTVKWQPTNVGSSGIVNSLPANADFLDEWNPVVVEIWVSLTNSSENGLIAANIDFQFDADYLTADTIEYGPGFTENQTGTIDNAAGRITGLGASTNLTGHGAETLVLLARVQLSVNPVPLNANGQYIQTVANLNFQIANSILTSSFGDVTVTEGAATNLTLVPALYDLNDNGSVDFRDLMLFAAVYRKSTGDQGSTNAWAADFDRSGTVNFRDLVLFATNYGKVQGSGSFLNYPSNFDEVWEVDTLLSVSDLVVDEDSQTVTLTVTSNQEVGGPFSISYSTVDGTAVSGVDYAATSGVLDFSGDTAGESQVITVQLIDDTLLELTEWFQITLENLTAEENIAFTQKQATIQIQNDDAIVIDEDAGEQIVELNGIATLNGNAQVDSVTVTSSDPSLVAVPHIEYTPGSLTTTLAFSPEPDANGSTLFEIMVTDDQGNQITHLIPVTVNPINDVPVAVNDFFSIDENSTLDSGNVFTSNPDSPDQDRDGQGFLVTAVSGGVVGIWFTLDSGARLKINSDGTFSYDPDQQFEFLAEDEAANDSFTYTIADEVGATDTATVQISINGVNDAPQVSNPISVTYSEDDPVDSIDLLMHASDADVSDVLSINNVVWTGDAGGVSINGTTLTIDPGYYNSLADGESASITGTYQIVDPHSEFVTQTISLQVDGMNDTPQVSNPISVTYSEDDPVDSIDLLMHASDADVSDVLSINNVVWTGDAGGVSINGTTLTIDPGYYNSLADGESASITGTYQIVDPHGEIVTQTISLQVDGVNDAPQVSNPISVTYSEDDPVDSIDLLMHASDADVSDVLSINNVVWTGDSGGISVNGTILTIDPGYYNSLADDESATIGFSFTVRDDHGGSVFQSGSILIRGENDNPIAVDDQLTADADTVQSIDVLQNDSDPDQNDNLSISGFDSTSASGASITVVDGKLHYDPANSATIQALTAGEVSTDTFSYTITDPQGETATAVVTIQLRGVNEPPYFLSAGAPLELNNLTPTRQVNLNDFFDDVDDASLTYQVISYSSGLIGYELSGAQLALTGLAGQSGNGTVVVEARDADGLTVTGEIAVVVDVAPVEQIEKLQYALVSDQVMDFHGQNTFVLETNVMDASQITVTSADSEVLSAADVTIESLGNGRLRVVVHHTSDEFGVTSLRFRINDQRIISDLNIIVIAPEGISLSDIGPLTMQLQEGQIPGEGTVISKTINARLPSVLVRDGIINAKEGLAMVRPVSPIVSAFSMIAEGASYENSIELDDSDNQTNYRTAMSSTTNGIKLWKTRFNLIHAYIIAYFEYTSPKETLSSVDISGVTGDVIQEVKSDPLSALAPVETVLHAVVNNSDFTDTQTGEIVTEEKRAELRGRVHTLINWVSLVNASKQIKELPKNFKKLTEKLQDLPKYQQVKEVKLFMLQTISSIKTLFEKGMEITQSWEDNRYVDKQVYARVIGQGRDFNSATFFSAEQLRTTVLEDDEISIEAKEIALESAETLQNTAEFHSYLLDELSIQEETDPSNSSVFIDSSDQPPEDPVSSDMEESSGENGKDNIKAIKDGDLVREVYSAAQSVYSITQSIQGIVDNIGQIFSSSGGAAGEYTDNDGHSYNIYENQNRSGSNERDIINTGEGNDRVFAKGGDDRVISSKGNDFVDAGHGRNYVFAAGGEDRITDGNGDSILSAGSGEDVIRPGGGNDLIEGGLGHDIIIYGDPNHSTRPTYDYRDIGNDILIDPTKSGEIHFRSHTFDEIAFRKDRYDLEIILPSDDGFNSNTLKFQSFFKLDAAGWEIIDSLGNHYNLYEVTGRITSYETLETVFGERAGNSTPSYPEGIVSLDTMQDSSTRFTMHVASDNRLADERGLVLTFEGDHFIDDWISRNEMASLEIANELLAEFNQQFQFSDYEHVTLAGRGEGGLIAQWFAAAASTSGVGFVNVQLVNSPDISGLISQVVREEFPEYTAGFPVQTTNYLINPNDWVSRIGIWAGNDETYASWRAFSFEYDAQEELPILMGLSEIQSAHTTVVSTGDFDELTMHDMDISHIRGHMSLMQSDDFSILYANDETTLNNQLFDSTTNAREVFFDTLSEESEDDDPIEASAPARNQFNAFLMHDPAAVNPDSAFSLKLDFQTAAQGTEHTAPDYHTVNETTLFTPEATELLTYGWSQITSGVKEGKDLGRATSLERDFVLVSENTFIVELPAPGTYNVSITFGDREKIRESTQVFVNGYASDRVSTMPGDFLTRSYQVNTLDDELRLTFVDRGGQTDFSALNGITVDQVNYRAFLPFSEQLDNDPSIVLMTGSYELPESNGFIDTLEDTLKAAAMAVATAVVPGIGAGLMSFSSLTTSFSSAFASAITAGVTNATVGSVIANSVGKAVVTSLVSSIPKNFISDPTARGILGGAISIYSGIDGVITNTNPISNVQKAASVLKKVSSGLGAINGSLTATNAIVQTVNGNNDAPPADEWMYEAAASLAQMSQKFRLGRIDAGFVPVSLDEINNAIANDKTGEQLLKLWTGSRDFLVLDWVPEGLELTDVSTSEHKNLVNKSARALKKLVEVYVEKLREGDPESQIDLLLISQGAGYDVHRELIDRLNTSDIEEGLDYVKIVTLDPVSFNEKTGRWVHPEMISIVDRVDNFFQSEDTPDGDLYHVGLPLDYRIGGGSAGFYNRQARVFDLNTTEELLRFRHWDANEVALSTAELTDIEFNADGSLVAASGKDGMVTVRYVDDVPDPDSETGELLHAAGDVKFIVWGQESIVRSLAFMQMQVDGVWKDFLLTISAAHNPENSGIDKNKVLLTDVETGLPVWQGRDIRGTQVEASPSGNLIISTDANGRAKIWKRVENTLTFEKHGDLVDAHPAQDGSYIADIYVINDRYFVTAGLDKRMKLFRITDEGAELVQTEKFDNKFQGKVRNLDYDPYNGILSVASGQELSLWKFNQTLGKLTPLGPEGQSITQPFIRHDHTAAIQGVSFSKPAFLLNADGEYLGDRVIPGTEIELPRTEDGDIDLVALPQFLESNQLSDSYAGLKLLTGGEDKTLFLYSLDRLDIGDVREEVVLSGAMLPLREVTLSPDGSRVAVVGQDNVEDDTGGPVKDIDVTDELDDRLGWKFSEIFLQGRREHNAVPQQYIYDVIEQKGESFFWLRNSSNANRPGSIDKDRNLALPPNKRDNKPGVDVAPIELYIRPGQTIDVKALHYLLEVDREDYLLDQDSLPVGEVKDENGVVVGTLRLKMKNGNPLPNILVFEAFDEAELDYSDPLRNEYTGVFTLTMIGPADLEGNQVEKTAEVKIRIINHKPTTYRDVVELHPNRSEIDYRPKANDYDFDNDDFTLYNFPTSTQVLTYQGEDVATVKKNSGSTNGINIVVTATEEKLVMLLAQMQASIPDGEPILDYLSLEFTYQVKEEKYGAISTGTVEVRLQLQAGPENITYDELGADQVRIKWDPVSWSANKYIVERYDELTGEWVKHTANAEVHGNQADSLVVKGLTAETDYWFRVVAINTNSERRHASYEGPDKENGLHVKTLDYLGPGSVTMETRGAAQIEVNWERVYWDLNKYIVELRELIVDDNGQLVMEGNEYRYNEETVREKEVSKGNGLSIVFKQLNPATPYLAIVTAKKGDEEQSTVAEYPVSTLERDLPAGINLERIGPKKIRVSWATIAYAEKYRIVAIDPEQPFLESGRIISPVVAATGGNSNSAVLTGLDPETEYLVIVEAKDKNGNWVSVIATEYGPTVISNTPVAENQSQIDVSFEGSSDYLLQYDFNNNIRLPSTDGLFVGTTFSIVNLSYHDVLLESFSGEAINLYGQLTDNLTLKPAIGPNVDPQATGIVVYRFTFLGDGWRVETSDNTSEARTVITPPYLAAEAGTFEKDEEDSLPKRLKVVWESPFWDVEKHRVDLYEVILDNEGQPLLESDGITYQRQSSPASAGKTKRLDEANDRFFAHTFTGLKTDTEYIAVLTTTGLSNQKRIVQEIHVKTEGQKSPKGVDYKDRTLSSFTATWTEVAWNVQQYRVSFAELRENGEVDESTRGYRYVNNDKSSKVVDNLKTGVSYQFTVEARTADPDAENEWIENTPENIKTVTILSAADLSIQGFQLDSARIRQLDLSWDELSFDVEELALELLLQGESEWTQAEKYSVGVNKVNFTLEELELNTDYQIRLVAKVKNSDGTTEPIISSEINGATIWGIDSLTEFSEIKVEVKFPRLAIASKYELKIYDASNSQLFAILDVNQKSSTTISYDLAGLKPGSKYDLELVAWDGMTKLTTSAQKSITMPAVEKPTGLEAEDKAKGKIKVTWNELSWVPDHQYVQVWTDQAASWTEVTGSDVNQGFSTVLQELEPGGVYQIRVVAVLDLADGTQHELESDPIPFTLRAYPAPDFGPVLTEAFQNVRQYKVDVHWTFTGNLEDIEKFQIIRENGNYLGALDAADFSDQTSFQLEIERTANSSYYVFVRAKYRDGELVDSITLQLPKIDTVPEFSVSNETEDSADANWNQVQNAGVTDYRIVVYERGTENIVNSKEVDKGIGSRKSTIDGLTQGTDYDMVVEALAGSDVIATSELKAFSTRTVPPVPNLTVDQIYPMSVRANWSQITGFTIDEYQILIYFKGSTVLATSKTVNRDSGDRHITVTGLTAETEYDLVVQALKGTTVLSTSQIHSFTTSRYVSPEFGTPTKDPFTDVRQKKVIVNWSFSGDPDNIATFQVVRENGTVLGTVNPANTPNQGIYEKEIDRSANSSYYVFIRANYKDGTKIRSSTLQLPKIDTVPGFTVKDITKDSAEANWDQVLNAGVTEYRIAVYARGTETLIAEKVVNKGTGSRKSTIDGLVQGTDYDMVLEALSGSEVIASSERVQFRTLVVPAVPNMFVDQIYPKSVQANWSQVTGFSVDEYKILIYLKGTSSLVTSKTVSKGSGDRRSTVDGLSENTQYEMVIQALDSSKVLSSSSRVVFTTSSYVAPDFGPTVAQAYTDVRKKKVVVNWSFSGVMDNVNTFQIVRENGNVLGTLNPASLPNQTSFAKEIDRSSNSKYKLFIRVNYKDGMKLTSITLQLPEA